MAVKKTNKQNTKQKEKTKSIKNKTQKTNKQNTKQKEKTKSIKNKTQKTNKQIKQVQTY